MKVWIKELGIFSDNEQLLIDMGYKDGEKLAPKTFGSDMIRNRRISLNKDLSNKTFAELKQIAETLGVKVGKTKAQTIENINNA